MRTPIMIINVPIQLNRVTSLPNIITLNQIKKALLHVLATLNYEGKKKISLNSHLEQCS